MPDQTKPTVLVTGAAGFVGARMVEVLHGTGTADVRAGIRRWSGAGIARLARLAVPLVMCDIMEPDQLTPAVEGVDIVIHSAMGSPEVNVEGTRHVLDAARQQGVQRVVFISTAEIYGAAEGKIDETAPYGELEWAYPQSKIAAEKLCLDYHKNGLAVSIVRPSIVYGPFSPTWVVRYADRLASGKWRTFKGYGDGFSNLIYVDDLVRGTWLAATREQAIGEAFNLNGPGVITWNEYFQRFNAALGRPPLSQQGQVSALVQTVSMETARNALVYAKNHLAEPVKKRLMGGTRKTRIGSAIDVTRGVVRSSPSVRELTRLYTRKAIFVDQKARDMLGYVPQFDVDRGLDLSVRWLVHHGFGSNGA